MPSQHRIFLTTAYLVPTRRLMRSLVRAARRGVDVHLLLPGVSDFWAPLQAGRSHYGRLLRAGVHLHELHDTLLHAKTCVIDGLWTTVGSSNLDWRSFLHNAEANLVVARRGPGAGDGARVHGRRRALARRSCATSGPGAAGASASSRRSRGASNSSSETAPPPRDGHTICRDERTSLPT